MVGTNTVLSDDPSLTTRFWNGKNPTRIIIDKSLKISKEKKVFDDEATTLVFNYLEEKNAGSNHFLKISSEKNSINQILLRLHEMQIQSVLVEGGAHLIQSFLEQDMWDEARIITNTQLFLAEGLPAPVFKHGHLGKEASIDDDLIQYYYH
jgi:diaminohydroxyphosphoribosylaminopyrimidine deaminase/5-amino-6-(5-phosphoribosylamino)uracil reductase